MWRFLDVEFPENRLGSLLKTSIAFICRWTSRLLPCPGYCKQCCDEHWGTHVSFNSGFLSVCPAVGLLGRMAVLFPGFEGTSTLFSIGFPGGSDGKESTYRNSGFDLWVGKIP